MFFGSKKKKRMLRWGSSCLLTAFVCSSCLFSGTALATEIPATTEQTLMQTENQQVLTNTNEKTDSTAQEETATAEEQNNAVNEETSTQEESTENTSDTSTNTTDTIENGLTMHIGINVANLYQDGVLSQKEIEAIPYETNGRTMVPLRFIGENILDCSVDYISSTREVKLVREDMKVTVYLKEGVVWVNDYQQEPYKLNVDPKPVEKNGYTFMPLRFFAELFHCTVDYNSTNKEITIIKNNLDDDDSAVISPDAPYAQVGFKETVAGQTIQYVDSSYDPKGLSIVAREWKLDNNNGTVNQGTSIEELTKNIKAGTYTVSLRVKNSAGLWSAWFSTTCVILPNEKPVVQNFKVVKKSDHNSTRINQGEEIDFTYTVENEEWEEITAEKWSYSWLEGGKVYTKAGKPSAFFSQDTYDINLSVKDAYGNWSDTVTAKVTPTSTQTMSEAEFKFSHLNPGEIYLNHENFNFNEIAESVPAQNIVKDDITLLASNNPESVTTHAILCQDTLQGDVRLRYHHKNSTTENMHIYALAHNKTDQPITLTISKLAAAGPSQDVMQVGTTVVEHWLTYDQPSYTKVLQPGEVYVVNQTTPILKPEESCAGLIDVHATGEVTFSIVSMKETSSYQNYTYLPNCPKNSTHIRGTFPNATLHMSYTLSGDQLEKIVLGREDAFDNYYISGVDKLTGESVVNKGNRGVVQQLTITAEEKVGILFNPRGSIYKGVLLNTDGTICTLSTSGIMQGIKEGSTVCVIEKGQTVTITYLPPSGSDTPLLLVSIPYDQWDEY